MVFSHQGPNNVYGTQHYYTTEIIKRIGKASFKRDNLNHFAVLKGIEKNGTDIAA